MIDGGQQPSDTAGTGRSTELTQAMVRLWALLAPEPGLFPELPFDAVSARARDGEMVLATPRLLDLVVGEGMPLADAAAGVELVGLHRWSDPQDREAIEAILDAWWLETLSLDVGERHDPERTRYRPGDILGVLVGYGAPMVRWLGPWLQALDGPGAKHLASAVLDGLDGPAWHGKQDQADQVLGWARTEPVVNGMILMGGSHLEDGELSAVLDLLI